ncbi:MAG: helix-turn-helix domain-containing protein [Candidatus Pristimantibacillus sp.]
MGKLKEEYKLIDQKTVELIFSEIGTRIRKERKKKKLTQKELSDRIRLSRTSITNIEQGFHKISVHTLFEISIVLDVDVHSLLPKIIDRH